VPAGLEPPAQQVFEQEGSEVPDVGVVVDRGTAGIQRDPPRLERFELLDGAGEGVVESEAHPAAAPAAGVMLSGVGPPSTRTWTLRWGTESRRRRGRTGS